MLISPVSILALFLCGHSLVQGQHSVMGWTVSISTDWDVSLQILVMVSSFDLDIHQGSWTFPYTRSGAAVSVLVVPFER